MFELVWDNVIVDRGRCVTCHASFGIDKGTFGACTSVADCEGPQLCEEGFCRAPGPWLAPHMFEGLEGDLEWGDANHRQQGLNSMYNMVALGQVDVASPLDSTLLTRPLLQDFQPTAIFGPGVDLPNIPPGSGVGTEHDGTSKFNFGCHEPPCPNEGIVDCRQVQACPSDTPCPDEQACSEGFCRLVDSVCDPTYVGYVRFAQYFAECKPVRR